MRRCPDSIARPGVRTAAPRNENTLTAADTVSSSATAGAA
jgi:hypothetical protein